MIWRLADLPELSHLSPQERRALLRRSAGRSAQTRLVVQSIVWGLLLSCIMLLLVAWFFTLLGISETWLFVAQAVCWIALSVGVYQFNMIRFRGQLRAALLEHLKEGGVLPVCIRCGYSFEPPVSPRCPECGAPAG